MARNCGRIALIAILGVVLFAWFAALYEFHYLYIHNNAMFWFEVICVAILLVRYGFAIVQSLPEEGELQLLQDYKCRRKDWKRLHPKESIPKELQIKNVGELRRVFKQNNLDQT